MEYCIETKNLRADKIKKTKISNNIYSQTNVHFNYYLLLNDTFTYKPRETKKNMSDTKKCDVKKVWCGIAGRKIIGPQIFVN